MRIYANLINNMTVFYFKDIYILGEKKMTNIVGVINFIRDKNLIEWTLSTNVILSVTWIDGEVSMEVFCIYKWR